MSSTGYSHLLTFMLPVGADRAIRELVPVAACKVEARPAGLIAVLGRSREAVFLQTQQLLEAIYKGPACSLAAQLYTSHDQDLSDGRDWLNVRQKVDAWTIIVNASVAFAPTGLGAEIPSLPRSQLVKQAAV